MKIQQTLLGSLLICSAPLAPADSAAEGPLALTATQMDQITAGQSTPLTAAAEAVADAIGQFTETGTNAGAWIIENDPANAPSSATTYLTVTTASGNAVATGPGAQSAVSTSVVNDQPFPDDSVVSTSAQYATTILGTTIAFQSQMSTSGNSVYFFNNPWARFGN